MVDQLFRSNAKFARSRWKCDLNQFALKSLKLLTNQYQFSIAGGDLIWLDHGWFVTHAGLIRLASRNRCAFFFFFFFFFFFLPDYKWSILGRDFAELRFSLPGSFCLGFLPGFGPPGGNWCGWNTPRRS